MGKYSIDNFLSSLGALVEVPMRSTDYPSMTTVREKQLLYRLAQQCYQGDGLIIDAGLFLGASTNAMGWGIRDNPSALKKVRERGFRPIQSYEIAIWHSVGFDKYLDNPLVKNALVGHVFNNGDNYDFLLRELLAQHTDLIDFHFGDIVKNAHVPDGSNVEIAFYDCLKNYERDLAAFRAFGPHYIPGKTILVQQDYFYEDALDNKIRQEYLTPYFEYLGMADSSAIFRMTHPIPSQYFESDPISSLSVDECIHLLESASQKADVSAYKVYAEVGVVRYMIQKGRLDDADKRLNEIKSSIKFLQLPPRPEVVIKQAQEWLDRALCAR